MEYWIIIGIVAIIMGLIGSYVAKEKGRSEVEGFVFGFFLSILGVIILGLLPTKKILPIKENFSEKNSNQSDSIDWKALIVFCVIIIVIIILWNYFH